ncbi:SpoIIAA family protein [Chachezhania sediminis]|uniref:STAS/SEC14 domain-containing protein n=1 Tax=Chachezhania sediminis TaxID=2599291 RepID=UPI00131C8C8B|nr:STAS/SEC14 domain-containing protein [Chachezhania sediminis]
MIEVKHHHGRLEAVLSGKVTQQDYVDILDPAVDAALAAHPGLKMLVIVAPDFDGYDMGAAWEDMRLGLSRWRGFDKIAVVTDLAWMAVAVRAAGVFMPCPVKVFDPEAVPLARHWLDTV